MKFVTFVATDHRPTGPGKTYKVVIEPHIFVLAVAEHHPGEYIALELAEGGDLEGLKLRILLRFASAACPGRDDHHNPPECKRQFTNRVSTKTFSTEAKFPSVANGTEGYSLGAAPGTEVQQCNDECHPTVGSSLSVQIFFKHKSILFQVIIIHLREGGDSREI
ncbi:putative L-carnitine dehydratase/alpha-methylacyl-CoA racemase [Anopheles sinensis]|uniref:Putative L-carnitine dehydratase/alpha-methylacyl-CoA racemase n=1 Tax=Anopheles sinensis TaxID=74873 RepID=A0A084VF51_ANOSI|nr:putative L-carnitine dehydratase/alpha-methylacyl-CoA racemase [Anopheles sinensis]